jgi:hypothetical protein
MLEVQYSVAIGTMDRGMNMLVSFVVSQVGFFGHALQKLQVR